MLDAIESALLVLLVVSLAFIWLVPIAGKWKVYGKLGMPGWYSIVPVYADYKLCERVHRGDGSKTFLMMEQKVEVAGDGELGDEMSVSNGER